MVSFFTCPVFVQLPPCLVTTGWDRKQGIQRSRLGGANTWGLHKWQGWIRTATCPKIQIKFGQQPAGLNQNCYMSKNTNKIWTTSSPYFKDNLYLVSYLILLKTNHSALFGQILAHWDTLAKTCYIWLHCIVSLISFMEGGLEKVAW